MTLMEKCRDNEMTDENIDNEITEDDRQSDMTDEIR